MFGTPVAVDTTGTKFELEGNSRVFDVVVSKNSVFGGFNFTVTANSFTQAADAAIQKANELRALYIEQNKDQTLSFTSYEQPFVPADVRKMETIRTHVTHFRHKEAA